MDEAEKTNPPKKVRYNNFCIEHLNGLIVFRPVKRSRANLGLLFYHLVSSYPLGMLVFWNVL